MHSKISSYLQQFLFLIENKLPQCGFSSTISHKRKAFYNQKKAFQIHCKLINNKPKVVLLIFVTHELC